MRQIECWGCVRLAWMTSRIKFFLYGFWILFCIGCERAYTKQLDWGSSEKEIACLITRPINWHFHANNVFKPRLCILWIRISGEYKCSLFHLDHRIPWAPNVLFLAWGLHPIYYEKWGCWQWWWWYLFIIIMYEVCMSKIQSDTCLG